MGIQINGQTDTISAGDGSLVVNGQQLTGVTDINASGIGTFSNGIRITGVGSSIGIGTNNPAEQLELFAGSERLMIGANSPSSYSRIAARNTTNTGYRGFQIDGSDLLINTNTSGNVIIGTGGGNTGVGTNSPADGSRLHIQGGGGLLVRRSAGTSIARFGNTGSVSPNITLFGSSTVNEPYIGCSADDLVFGTSNTERMRITSNAYVRLAAGTGGIQFNGDTAAANALDDYEEGTWTITIATEGGSNYTLGNQFNRYVKVGNLVFVRFNVEFTAEGSGTIAVFNLPFTASTSETFILNGFVSQGNNRLSLQYTNYTSSTFLPRYDNGTAYVNYWTPNTAWAPPNNFVGVGCYSVN